MWAGGGEVERGREGRGGGREGLYPASVILHSLSVSRCVRNYTYVPSVLGDRTLGGDVGWGGGGGVEKGREGTGRGTGEGRVYILPPVILHSLTVSRCVRNYTYVPSVLGDRTLGGRCGLGGWRWRGGGGTGRGTGGGEGLYPASVILHSLSVSRCVRNYTYVPSVLGDRTLGGDVGWGGGGGWRRGGRDGEGDGGRGGFISCPL